MSKYTLILALVLCLTSFLTACSASNQEGSQGQILIWHSWEGKEREVFKQFINNYRQLNPEIAIVEDSFSLDELEDAYRFQVEAGLGPDILIAPADWAARLADAGTIQDISGYDIDLDVYFTAANDTLRRQEEVYGLPLSLNTFVLYYNKPLLQKASTTENVSQETAVTELIQSKLSTITDTETVGLLDELLAEAEQNQPETVKLSPATNLTQLLEQANSGQTIAMPSGFYQAFWGVQAFGGRLFDDEGRVVLNQGGFANWLSWLKKAQDNPNIVLNRNPDELLLLFTSGKATYYIGSTNEFTALKEALGEEVIGVTRLPGRGEKLAGPFMRSEAMMFNRVSTRRNTTQAIELAKFLTNAEQQRQFALLAGKLPVNKLVNIDSRIDPVMAEFIAQSKTAVPISLEKIDQFEDLLNRGNDFYAQVLGGEIGVGEAATWLTKEINDKYEQETVVAYDLEDCDVAGKITLWNTWTGKSSDALKEIQKRFNEACAQASLTVVDVDPAEFYDRYVEAFDTEEAPDLFTGNNQLIRRLGSEERLLNLSDLLDPEFLQQFIPLVERSLLFEGSVYGIPVSLNTYAIYYNTELVQDPPISLDDLPVVASPETQVAIPLGFQESYWGIATFSQSNTSQFLDEEGHFILQNFGLTDWLTWLKEARPQPGMILSRDSAQLQTLFTDETAVLLVGSSRQLGELQEALGADKVGVLPLPSGGSPLLEVDNLLFHPLMTPEERQVALIFAKFMTNERNQRYLMEQANRVPTNINVSTGDYPAIRAFIQQADVATVIPNVPQIEAVFQWGNSVYEQVLDSNITPVKAVEDFTNVVDATNGLEITELGGLEEGQCTDKGHLILWHSWNETEEAAWQEVLTDFNELCPELHITPTYISTVDFGLQLSATLEITGELPSPDFFIASQANLESYQNQKLIQDIALLVDKSNLLYLPKTVQALSVGDSLYGLPQSIHLPALYYHPKQVETVANTFTGLLEQAKAGTKIAMNADFYELFWGTGAFGCQLCQSGQIFNEQGEFALTKADLDPWLDWLEEAEKTGKVIFSTDQAALEALFLAGEVSYLVADVSFLNQAQSQLGLANVGIITLPFGQEEQGSTPFMTIDSFFFHSETTQEQLALALKFVSFVSTRSSQILLMQQANFIPTNKLAIVTANDPDSAPFISKIDTSVLLPSQSKRDLIAKSNLFNIYKKLESEIKTDSEEQAPTDSEVQAP